MRRNPQAGFSLVETVVAFSVLATTAIGLYELIDSSDRVARQETQTADAQAAAHTGMLELARLVRQAGAGGIYYGNAILPVANNSPGGQSVADLSGKAHYIRKGTDVVSVRGTLLSDQYAVTSDDVACSGGGGCDGSSGMSVTLRATAGNGAVNFAAGTSPAIAARTRPFYFVVTDSVAQTITVGTSTYLARLYYVGLVSPAGNWLVRNGDAYTFTMLPQDAGARKFDAADPGARLQRPAWAGAFDEVLFFTDEGTVNGTGSKNDTHPMLAEAILDASTGRYDIQPLVGEVEDLQVAYGIDGIDGSAPDGGVSAAAKDTSGVNKDEWVGDVANEVESSLPISSTPTAHVNAFLATATPSVNPYPVAVTAALRSVWLSLVVKAADPEIKYGGAGSRGIRTLDSSAVSFSDAASTGRAYRRRVQSFVVSLKNFR